MNQKFCPHPSNYVSLYAKVKIHRIVIKSVKISPTKKSEKCNMSDMIKHRCKLGHLERKVSTNWSDCGSFKTCLKYLRRYLRHTNSCKMTDCEGECCINSNQRCPNWTNSITPQLSCRGSD